MTFTEAKEKFDLEFGVVSEYKCFLSEHLSIGKTTQLRKKDGSKNEQYYKWQFLYSLVNSGLFPKDLIGTEVHFPKGNKDAANIKLDAAVFADASWWDKYVDYHTNNNVDSLEWLRKNLVVAIEFKKEDSKNIQEVWDKQLKAYMKESDADFCLGILYMIQSVCIYFAGIIINIYALVTSIIQKGTLVLLRIYLFICLIHIRISHLLRERSTGHV